MTSLDSVFKSRDITLLTKIYVVKVTVFPAVMYRCESWTIKKAEHRKLMLSSCGAGEDSATPFDCKKIKPGNFKGNLIGIFIGRTDAESELQYSDHLMQRWTHPKRLILREIEGRKRRGDRE